MQTRILIADDSLPVRSLLRHLLKSHSDGWEICAEATNGLEAVQKALELKPDLVIIDLQMPLMDGLEASREILQALPRVPILINTVHKSDYIELEAKKAGVRSVLSKSDSEALLQAIETLVGEFRTPARTDAGF